MPPPDLPETVRRMLTRRDTVASAASAAVSHGHDDSELLETIQYDLEELLEDLLPVELWRQLMPTWRLTDVQLAHDPSNDPRPAHCQLCAAAARTRPRDLPLAASA